MNLYYRIWVDGIVKLRSRPQNAGLWKFFALTFMSMAMALNLVLLLLFLSDIGITNGVFKIQVNTLPGTRINAFISFFLSYLAPFLLLNYLLIFYNNRYEVLIKRYPSSNGRLFMIYFLASLIGFIGYITIAIFIVKAS